MQNEIDVEELKIRLADMEAIYKDMLAQSQGHVATLNVLAKSLQRELQKAQDEAAILRKKLADATKKVADADTATIVEKAANSNGHAAEGLAH
jgi:hypothetical protein